MTESDVVYKVIAFGQAPNTVRVYEIMTKPCIVVNPDLEVEYVARLFADHHLQRAPVIQGDLMGIICLTDIMGKSSFLKQPRTILLEQQLQDEIKKARTTCERQGVRSEECGAAWDVVDELQCELAHQCAERVVKTAFDEFCDELPEARDARVYDTWCSG